MKYRYSLRHRIRYVAFCIPLILAFLSWAYFPAFANWIITNLFGYHTVSQQANVFWLAAVQFFYGWYTFLAIGVAGVFTLAATFARLEQYENKMPQYPMVSFVVPAYNEEGNVARCIQSLFRCTEKYLGQCEIIVVDDGSRDYTYEVAWSAIELNRRRNPSVRGKVVRHSANLGKVQAIKTGVDRALGSLIAVVDADSWWRPDTLKSLVGYMLSNGKKAVTGYIHPTDGASELDSYVLLQQLEYSQGLSIIRQAQSLSNNVLVVSGALSLYDANVLRNILDERNVRSVTEDLEIALEMHRRGEKIGYTHSAVSISVAPVSFRSLWRQRLRWFTGWLHNTLKIHREMLMKKSWLSLFLWYCYIFEYGGTIVDLAALAAFPLVFWFAPDHILFIFGLFIYGLYSLFIGLINQSIALKYAYSEHNYKSLLFYTPFYPILRLINIAARLVSSVKYIFGDNGSWYTKK
ncbi:glycosyltransferase family 2 protein [Candidatus Bathyarchaeota archaeon]|nr:glycosyltransferase family 2 protein [Candidatus Bathyarchaeota archaeon]